MACKSVKQQLYEQLAQQHVQEAMNNIGLEQFQAAYDDWNKQQEGLANFEAQFNAWNEANPVQAPEPVKQISASAPMPKQQKAIPSLEKTVDLSTWFAPRTASGRDLNKEAAEREKKFYATMEDYQRQQQEEQILASKGKKAAQKNQPAQKQNRDGIGGSINQLDLSKYNLPEAERDEATIKNFEDLEKAKAWTDPNYKLTKEEQAEAKRIAREGIERLERRETDNPAYIGRKRSEMSPEEREQYDTFKNLETKSSSLKSFAIGAADKALDYAKAALQGVANTQSRRLSAENETKQALGLNTGLSTEELKQFEPETRENIKQLEEDTSYARSLGTGAAPLGSVNLPVLGEKEITPYGLGQTATQFTAYGLTNPAFDMLGTALGAGTGIAGKTIGFVGNQVGQNMQDYVLDTSLVMDRVMNDPTLTDQQRADAILESIEMNAIGNLAAYGLLKALPEGVAKLVKKGLDNTDSGIKHSLTEIANTPTDDISIAHRQVENKVPGVRNFVNITENDAVKELDKDGKITKILNDYPSIKRQSDAPKKAIETIESEKHNFSNQIDRYAHGDMEENELFDLGSTPEILKEHGLKGKTIKMTQRIFDKITLPYGYRGNDNGHGFGREGVEKFIDAFEDPAIIFKADDDNGIGVVINIGDKNGTPTLIPITIGKDGLVNDVNDIIGSSKVKTAHIRTGLDNYLEKRGAKITYIKGDEEPLGVGLWSAELHDSSSPNPNVTDVIPNVNKETINNKVMAEDIGLEPTKPEPVEPLKIEEEIPPTGPEIEPQPEAPNMKVSETYTNTGKRGGGWNEEEYGKYTDPQNYTYETIDELRSVEEATNMRAAEGREAFKNRVLNQEKVSSIELDGLMMEWRELTQEARALEAAGEDASKLWEESNRIFRKVQTQSTANAQALQSLAKWSRNTPEGMLLNAENIVNGKTKANKTELQKFIDKHFKNKKGEIQFSPEFEKEFLNTAESLRGLTGTQLDSREAKEAMAKLGKMVNEQLPVKLNEKLQSFLMDNMLGNFRTLITRNAGGNLGLNAVEQTLQRPLAAGIDSLVSLKTGKRTQAGLTWDGLLEYIQGFGKGLADEGRDFKSGLHTARSGENTLENAIRANRHVFKTKVADGLDGLVKHGLSVGDRPYYEAVYKQTLGDYQRLFDRGLMGSDIQTLSPEDFKVYAETAAKMNALGAVYQQDTMLSKALLDLKKGVGELSDGILGVDILSQFSMPFVKTPANVIERAIDYSPLGLVRNAFRTGKELKAGGFDQSRFANESARNILGTALMGGGAAYAANGGLSGKYSSNKNEKQAQKESGMQEYAWNVPEPIPGIGGMQMDISWLPVVGSNLVASAAAVDAYKNGEGNFGENLTEGLQAGGKALFDQSMFQGLQRLFGTGESYNSDEGIVGNMRNVVTSGAGQAIPSLLRQTAQVTDENQRDLAYSNKGTSFGPFDSYAINSLANNIPGVRENYLAPKVDTSGNILKENQGRNVGMKILEDMILPGKLTNVNMSPLAQEASRLSEATENAFIPKADRTAIDSEDHTLTNEEWVSYQQNYYREMTKAGNLMVGGDIYKNANEETQAKLLHDTYGAIKSAINSEYTGKEVSGAAKAYKEAGGGTKGAQAVVDYYSAKKLTDDAGISTTSKAAKEIQEAVASGDITAANQKADEATTIRNAGIDSHGYDVYKANKASIKNTDDWISEYKKIDSLGNSDGFVNQDEFLSAVKKNNWSESEAVKYSKLYGNWKQIPYLKKDGTWGFHKTK
ncbi:MAG: hypothetical protein K6C96_10275 [Butyrivibrio sp.]|nr:hypothetical protein [Butyrivibrio sp.]